MANEVKAAVQLAQAEERLRQEALIADENLAHARAMRRVKVAASWTAVLVMPFVAFACVYVLTNYEDFPAQLITTASATLFVGVFGVASAAYRSMVVRKTPESPLRPTTEAPTLRSAR
ncbi:MULTISPECIES: hypothetical protein [Actinosynnema]|uniref:hypothetical protein n=1 Tax=Actinosynnema TaxID=40566 RepID=UPI0020A5EB61|nr:hypothetical protein [Actinosynnema pretiosum]MCP2092472.1 hypothetical protein [Actinosynnema pretiosum]